MQDKSSSAAKAYVCHALDWVVGKSDGMVKGRMKYNRPIFLAASYVDYHYFVTLKAYMDNRLAFHPIAHTMIEKVCPFHYFCLSIAIMEIYVCAA